MKPRCYSIIPLTFLALTVVLAEQARAQTERADSLKYWVFLGEDAQIVEQNLEPIGLVGARIVHTSDWLHAVSAWISTSDVDLVRELPQVVRLSPVARARVPAKRRPRKSFMELVATQSVWPPHSFIGSYPDYGPSQTQLIRSNILPNLQQGIVGTGIRLGIIDTGLGNLDHPAFSEMKNNGRFIESRDFTGVPDDGSRHGSYVLSVAAGYLDGQLVGPAYGADIYHARSEVVTSETRQEEDNLVAALEWMVSEGVDVVNISLSYTEFDLAEGDYSYSDMNGLTAVGTIAADMAVQAGVVVVTSAGNEAAFPDEPGTCPPDKCWYYIGSPADGFSVISVGATTPLDEKADFSSFGPTFDGRTKPDVSAMGTNIAYANSQIAPGCNGVVCTSGAGTSFSAPLVAGIVAQMLQVNPMLEPAEVREILRATARHPETGNAAQVEFPNDSLGWGIVDAAAAVAMATAVVTHLSLPTSTVFSAPFPNPARDKIQFVGTNSDISDRVQIDLYDVLGRRILRQSVEKNRGGTQRFELDTSAVPPGMYLFRISTGDRSESGTIVLVR